jgi:hypothetical protein
VRRVLVGPGMAGTGVIDRAGSGNLNIGISGVSA